MYQKDVARNKTAIIGYGGSQRGRKVYRESKSPIKLCFTEMDQSVGDQSPPEIDENTKDYSPHKSMTIDKDDLPNDLRNLDKRDSEIEV